MHIVNSRRYFLDSLVELLGIKRGFLISKADVVSLLSQKVDFQGWWVGPENEGLRLEAGAFEFTFETLLLAVGAIAELTPRPLLVVRFCKRHAFDLPMHWLEELTNPDGPDPLFEEPFETFNLRTNFLTKALNDYIHDNKSLPRELASLDGIQDLVDAYSLRAITTDSLPTTATWNGVISLKDLFHSEAAPSDPATFFDQRYIDYLAAQPDRLVTINWRQFERLTAEYFRRMGYTVTIGPGRADGGTDVTAIRTSNVIGPELVMIQCKRYGENTPIKITDVQAFWTVANDENATRAFFVTTTTLPSGVREWCEAKKYRISAVEGDNVRKWLEQMKSAVTTAGTPAQPSA